MAANTSGIKCHNFCFQKTTPDLVIVRMLLKECYKGAGFSFMCSFKFRGFLSRTFLASLSKTICWPHILTSSSLSRVVCLALTIIVYWIAIFLSFTYRVCRVLHYFSCRIRLLQLFGRTVFKAWRRCQQRHLSLPFLLITPF